MMVHQLILTFSVQGNTKWILILERDLIIQLEWKEKEVLDLIIRALQLIIQPQIKQLREHLIGNFRWVRTVIMKVHLLIRTILVPGNITCLHILVKGQNILWEIREKFLQIIKFQAQDITSQVMAIFMRRLLSGSSQITQMVIMTAQQSTLTS